MTSPYRRPEPRPELVAPPRTAYLVASGDLRESANTAGWPTQARDGGGSRAAFAELGWTVGGRTPWTRRPGHGFIAQPADGPRGVQDHPAGGAADRRRGGVAVQPPRAGRPAHATEGPILTVANFAGDWPGLVGLLGLNAGPDQDGQAYSTIWSVDFTDQWFLDGIASWIETGTITHDDSHVRAAARRCPTRPRSTLGRALAAAAAAREGDHRRVRRGLHGHVQRDHRRRAAQPARHLQGAAVAERAVRRDAHGDRRRGRGGRAWLDASRDDGSASAPTRPPS